MVETKYPSHQVWRQHNLEKKFFVCVTLWYIYFESIFRSIGKFSFHFSWCETQWIKMIQWKKSIFLIHVDQQSHNQSLIKNHIYHILCFNSLDIYLVILCVCAKLWFDSFSFTSSSSSAVLRLFTIEFTIVFASNSFLIHLGWFVEF